MLCILKNLPLLLFILFCITSTNIANPINSELEPFYLHEFLNGTFQSKGWNGTWISDDTFIIKTHSGDYNKVNAVDFKQEEFLKSEVFANYNGSSLMLSHDQKYVLIRYNQKAIFRHSKTAQYVIYDINKKAYYDVESKEHIQYAAWSPLDSTLVYVYANNIYYISKLESPVGKVQITADGIPGVFYNGVPDWVYEEEVLGTGHALWFSPDGKRLAFVCFNDTNVQEFQYYIYGEPGKLESQYPETVRLRYPKVGTTNPSVTVKYVNFEDPSKIIMLPGIIPESIVTHDHIITGVTWSTNTDVVAVSQNRVQNVAAVTRCSLIKNFCNVELNLRENSGWLQLFPPIYNKQGTQSILLVSQEEGGSRYKHLVLFDIQNQWTRRLTFGKRVVLSVKHWDDDKGMVYYSSTVEEKPTHQHTYVVNVNTLVDACITCSVQTPEGSCKVALTHFSKGFNFCSNVCNGPGPAFIEIEHLKAKETKTWEENLELRTQLGKKLHPIIKDVSVSLASGFMARARLWLPPNLDETKNVKYPMVVDVYAGPNSNKISDSFTTGVLNYFTTYRKYIYAQIDARGSGRNADSLIFQVYRKLGTVEVDDQIAVTKYLTANFPFIDSDKIGIWGWSYGGFATVWTLIKDQENIFKFGLSVAPVTNFVQYDTIYTERYMGLPTDDDNILGYNNTDATQYVENLRNKTFFLIHGNADDNVHYQQSMLLARALERADIMFYQQSYPDENHSLGGVLPHLYHTIDRYFTQGFRSNKV